MSTTTEAASTDAAPAAPRAYPLTCKVSFHEAPVTAEEARADDAGAGDALMIAAIAYDPDGVTVTFATVDGRSREALASAEIFRLWSHMATKLAADETLDAGKRELCRSASQILARAIDDAVQGPAT